MNDSVIASRARALAARCRAAAKTPKTAAAGRRTIGHQRGADGNTAVERAPPEILLRGGGGVERLVNLRLQSCLLVEADLEVRQDRELRARLRIALHPPALVVRERLAQVTLPVRRIACLEPVEEALEHRGIGSAGPALVQVARELEPDLLEDLQVPARDRLAGSPERVEGRVQCAGQTAEPRLALEEALAQQAPPQRRDRVQQPAAGTELAAEVLQQVLASNRPPGLSRRPRRVRAPVRARAFPFRERRGETRVAVGDLEVADHRVRDRRDSLDVGDARSGLRHERARGPVAGARGRGRAPRRAGARTGSSGCRRCP